MKLCDWCRLVAVDAARGRFCGKKCRQAAFRQRRRASTPTSTGDVEPGRFAYADPPYPGMAWMYKDQPSYAGEVDHGELIRGLEVRRAAGELKGWALSTSSKTLHVVLPFVPPFPASRVHAWVKPTGVSGEALGPVTRWEPLIVVGGRKMPPGVRDWAEESEALRAVHAKGGGSDLVGRKPQAFAAFLFDMLGMLPGDDFEDLFPGSGAVSRAWRELSTMQQRQLSLELPSLLGRQRRPAILELLEGSAGVVE